VFFHAKMGLGHADKKKLYIQCTHVLLFVVQLPGASQASVEVLLTLSKQTEGQHKVVFIELLPQLKIGNIALIYE
jgi:hypothetical protein